jgi:hypothetical protein
MTYCGTLGQQHFVLFSDGPRTGMAPASQARRRSPRPALSPQRLHLRTGEDKPLGAMLTQPRMILVLVNLTTQ